MIGYANSVLVVICIFAVIIPVTFAGPLQADAEGSQVAREKRQTTRLEPQNCSEVGGYCKYHTDCCSNLCLSFSYRCVTRPPISIMVPTVVQAAAAGGPAIATNEVLDNRFGEGSSAQPVVPLLSPAPKCAAVGEYCQYSAQCCSKRCLSFSYKCVPDPQQAANRPFVILGPPSSIFEVGQPIPQDEINIEDLVNRFGEESQAPAPSSPAQSPQVTTTIRPSMTNASDCVAHGEQCEFSNQCCSDYCALATLNTRVCSQRNEQPDPSAAAPGAPQQTTPSFVNNRCLVIGAPCYNHVECCSERCHIYLHKCVT